MDLGLLDQERGVRIRTWGSAYKYGKNEISKLVEKMLFFTKVFLSLNRDE